MGDMHAFPTVQQLQAVTDEDLRSNGFGYRAAYIAETASLLHEKESETDRTGVRYDTALLQPEEYHRATDCALGNSPVNSYWGVKRESWSNSHRKYTQQ